MYLPSLLAGGALFVLVYLVTSTGHGDPAARPDRTGEAGTAEAP
jgi:hypothetical protein